MMRACRHILLHYFGNLVRNVPVDVQGHDSLEMGIGVSVGDGTEAPVDRVAVPKTGQKPPSPREDATETPVGRVAVPKTGQRNALPRGDATEMLVGRVPAPKTGIIIDK